MNEDLEPSEIDVELQLVQTPAPPLARDRDTAPFYVLVTDAVVYVKGGEFFRSQEGLTSDWGRSWTAVDAPTMADAYVIGERVKAERLEAL